MKEKSEASQVLRDFCSMTNSQFGAKIKIIRHEDGYEFTSGPMKKFQREPCMIHQTNWLGSRQQNGRVKRKYRHILNVTRALYFWANLPVEFWGE